MKKVLLIMLAILIPISIITGFIFALINHYKQTNEYNYIYEEPTIEEVIDNTKKYLLNEFGCSGKPFDFIRKEKLTENYLVYYFEIRDPYVITMYGLSTRYIKAIFKYEKIYDFEYGWNFYKVMRSSNSEAKEK